MSDLIHSLGGPSGAPRDQPIEGHLPLELRRVSRSPIDAAEGTRQRCRPGARSPAPPALRTMCSSRSD